VAAEPSRAKVGELVLAPSPPPEESAGAIYRRALRSHLLLVALIVITALAASVLLLKVRAPTYQADAQLLITPISSTDANLLGLPLIRDTGESTRTAQTAAALLQNPEAARIAAQQVGGGLTPGKVQDAVTIEPRGQTNLLVVQATSDGAQRAAQLADAYATAVTTTRTRALQQAAQRQLADTQAQIDSLAAADTQTRAALQARASELRPLAAGIDPSLSLAESARAPLAQVGLPAPLILALALLAGVVIATGTALLLELRQPGRVLNEDELRALARLPILARLPNVRRARSMSATALADERRIREALRNVAVQLDLHVRQRRSVMFVSGSRSDGKTTAVLGLALELSASGADVVLVDADLRQPRLREALGMRPRAIGEATTELREDLTERVPGVAHLRLVELRDLVHAVPAGHRARDGRHSPLRMLSREVEWIIIDTPALGQVSDALTLARDVDDVVLVARLGNTRRSELEAANEMLLRSGAAPTGLLVVGTDWEPRAGHGA
jgi:Mrp family chromosome partitioning ATPase